VTTVRSSHGRRATRLNTANYEGYNCALFNPGIGNTFTLDMNGDGKLETIYLSAADLGIPPVKRSIRRSTWVSSMPSTASGGRRSTTPCRVTTVTRKASCSPTSVKVTSRTTQAFDFPEFSVNADGLLPNDRTHQIKAFGYYQLTEELGIGGTRSSPRAGRRIASVTRRWRRPAMRRTSRVVRSRRTRAMARRTSSAPVSRRRAAHG
jgi:hypothetical protein